LDERAIVRVQQRILRIHGRLVRRRAETQRKAESDKLMLYRRNFLSGTTGTIPMPRVRDCPGLRVSQQRVNSKGVRRAQITTEGGRGKAKLLPGLPIGGANVKLIGLKNKQRRRKDQKRGHGTSPKAGDMSLRGRRNDLL